MGKLSYSMQDWFLRVAFAPSCGASIGVDESKAPIAETHNAVSSDFTCGDFDVVINSTWVETATDAELRAVLLHECSHAIESFLASRPK